MNKTDRFSNSRTFYENEVAPMIHGRFPQFEDRIAVGIAGEGSDCFGYDDLISRDHDFGTGVCLWLTDEDYDKIANMLSIAYTELVNRHDAGLSERLMQRRGVMRIHDFYSDILAVDCDVKNCVMTDDKWHLLDHSCLATAVNGEVFKDNLGVFSAFRKLLLNYYPDNIRRERLAGAMHTFSACLQVNYARCMSRGDLVAASICKSRGLEAAMELFFLIKRVYPPYYKWTYRALRELDTDGAVADLLDSLARAGISTLPWLDKKYNPDILNKDDEVIVLSEEIASQLIKELNASGIVKGHDPYLERYVDDVLK